MKKEKLYHIAYDIKPYPEGIKKNQLEPGWGACNSIVIGSIINNEDGSCSYVIRGLDGRANKPLNDDELFKFWATLANQLSESKTLGKYGRRELCALVHETVKRAILKAIKEKEENT